MIWCLPMAHHFLITIVLIEVGATMVLAQHVTAKPLLENGESLARHGALRAPFHYSMWARDNSGRKSQSVRLAVSTTCALPTDGSGG